METLQHVFLLHQAPPPPAAPTPAQGPPFPPTPGIPLMPDSPGEAYVVIDLPDTPEILVVSSEDKGHQEEEDDPKEDQDIDEAGVEQQWDQKIDEMIVEQQADQEVGDAKLEASTSSFNLGEEPDDEFDPDYDPSRDRLVVLEVGVNRLLLLSPIFYIAWSVWMDVFCVGYDIVYSKLDPLRP